ncbi:MAG: hypothetical protein R3Y53_10595 [Bacillota bacterium]
MKSKKNCQKTTTTETPITLNHHEKTRHFAFDGTYYYFTIPDCKEIVQTDLEFAVTNVFPTAKCYDAIAYDVSSQKFFVTAMHNYTTIYELNCCMEEIDCICFSGGTHITGAIADISYNCSAETLLVAYPTCIMEVTKDGTTTAIFRTHNAYITSICSLCPYLIYTEMRGDVQTLHVLDETKEVHTVEIASSGIVSTMVFHPYLNDDDTETYYIDYTILKKGYYPFMEEQLLDSDWFEVSIDSCNFDILTATSCDCTENSCNAIDEIIHSVALVEASLAGILNAEGEKIQYALTHEEDVETVLRVNEEVRNTLVQATHLEQILYHILSFFKMCKL